jgi:hypothetical protein
MSERDPVEHALAWIKSAIGACMDKEPHSVISEKLWSATRLLHKAIRKQKKRKP